MQVNYNPKRIENDGIAYIDVGQPFTGGPCYSVDISKEYKHPLLSLENLTYYREFPNIDYAEDDYLMYHALQDSKKICVTIDTYKKDVVIDNFSKYDYNIFTQKNIYSKDENNYQVIITKKGTLNDYYDIDEILEIYKKVFNMEFNCSIINEARGMELIDVMTGKLKRYGTPFSHKIIFRRDDNVFKDFKQTGIMLDGLLLGYPIESTADLIRNLWGNY